MSLRKLFGKNLSTIRKKHGLSQGALAELINMQTHTIGQIETGKRAPSFDTIEKLSNVLKVDYYELFEFDNMQNNSVCIKKILKILNNSDKKTLALILENIESLNKYLNNK